MTWRDKGLTVLGCKTPPTHGRLVRRASSHRPLITRPIIAIFNVQTVISSFHQLLPLSLIVGFFLGVKHEALAHK